MTWAFPFSFLLLIPLILIVAYLVLFQNKNKASFKYSFLDLLPKNYFSLRSFFSPLPHFLKILAILFCILALARPQSVKERSEQNIKGIDIMIVVDISLSMLVEDMGNRVTRLNAAKAVISRFVEGRLSDRIGLIVFSGESFTKVPLTLDYELVLKNLQELKPMSSIKPGTAIGVALANASTRLKHSSPDSRVIIFLTDGENNAGFIDPETALQIVQKNKIKVYTVGLGSVSGRAPILYEGQDQHGRMIKQRVVVESRINKELMKEMAEKTDGKFFMAQSANHLRDIFKDIDKLEKQDIKLNKWIEYNEHFSSFLKWSVIFYFLSLFLSFTVFFRGV